MTLSTIRTEIRSNVKRTDIDTIIDDQINAALSHIGTRWELPPLITTATTPTSDGVATYLLPSDLFAVLGVRENTVKKTKLEDSTVLEYQRRDRTATAGLPGKWARSNDLLYIFDQIPNDNDGSNYEIEVLYWKRHPQLTNDADRHLLTAEWESMIRLFATSLTFAKLNEFEKAKASLEMFNAYLEGRGTGKHTERSHAQDAFFNFSA